MTTANLQSRRTMRVLAQMFHVSERSLYYMKEIKRTATSELMQEIKEGRIKLNLARQIARFNPDSQRLIIAELPDMPPRKKTAFVRVLLRVAAP